MEKNFNIILTGVGGQGIITLLSLINEAALIESYDVKSSELHGLSQRGGSVEAHVRFGKKVLSPLVPKGSADLVIGMEMIESYRETGKAGEKANFLVNRLVSPFQGSSSAEEIEAKLKEAAGNRLHLVSASEICKNELQNEVVMGLYLLGYAVNKKLIPLMEKSVIEAVNKIIPQKYLELNLKALNLANVAD